MLSFDQIKTTTLKLLGYCRANNWAGWDPYDALNSPVFKYLPFLDSKWPRIAFTQFLKRSPVNLRPLLLVPKTENPKAIALFLMAFLKLRKLGLLEDESLIPLMIQKLITLRSPDIAITRNPQPVTCNLKPDKPNNPINPNNSTNPTNPSNPTNLNNSYLCWGYNFDWQSRSLFVPQYTPNIICTTFCGNALLDAYEKYGDPYLKEYVMSAGHYIVNSLIGTDNGDEICFSYTPLAVEQVHNANLLGAAFLSRLYNISGEKLFIDYSLKATRYSVRRQREDGSWPYAEHAQARWVDNFHTGYNLVSLNKTILNTGNNEFLPNLQKGLDYYKKYLFTKDGIPKYYNSGVYPIDIHSIAQSIITFVELNKYIQGGIGSALVIFDWAYKNMWSENGYFYYRKTRWMKNKISYIRWSQAWMFYALAALANEEELS